ncbi:MAG: hypothetical protein ING44_05985 [Telmatospirillum sp.]|nr:hypothetical protein [Telmatospirillum sp.]
MRSIYTLLALLLALAGTDPASAQTTPAPASPAPGETADLRAPGRLNAQAYRDVPATGSVRVRPYDDTRENRRLQTQIERAVERKGRRIEEKNADLALSFEIEVRQVGRAGPPQGIGSFTADRNDARLRLNLYSNSEDSLVNPRRAELGSSGSVQYTMVISLDDARGTRLWQGTATLLGAPGDETSAYGAMARALIDEFGQTARQKPFRVE